MNSIRGIIGTFQSQLKFEPDETKNACYSNRSYAHQPRS
jgi:hypothetical protein